MWSMAIELQLETGFVLQDFPSDGAVPREDVAIHATDGIASVRVLGDGGVEHEIAESSLGSKTVIVVPLRGVLLWRGGIAQAVAIDLGEDGGLEPVIIKHEGELFTRIHAALAVFCAL